MRVFEKEILRRAKFALDERDSFRVKNVRLQTSAGRILIAILLALFFVNSPVSMAEARGEIGIMGDSLAAATHSSQMCGSDDIVECLDNKLGGQSRTWSYASGAKSWSIARRLGYTPEQVIDASDNGEEWKDAIDQAKSIMANPEVEKVFIGLGTNDICQTRGHDYTGDLETIARHIDDTLTYLTDRLSPGGEIYWSAVPNLVAFRDLMVNRNHNYAFDNCQATWDLDENKLKNAAKDEACQQYFGRRVCDADIVDEAADRLVELIVQGWLRIEEVEEGTCGKVLSSRSTDKDREEARALTIALNQLMAEKAQSYDGRNGIAVFFSDGIYRAAPTMRPYHISRLDCFHPNRVGQMKLANEVWKGFNRGRNAVTYTFFDEFDSQNYCEQEFTTWGSCWTEIGEDCGPTACDIKIRGGALQVRNADKGISRRVNLEDAEEAWVAFTYQRDDLDRQADYVSFDVSPDDGKTWFMLDRVKGDGDDLGTQRGRYYDISPYATANTRIRFLGANGLGSNDKVFFDNVKIFAWQPKALRPEVLLPVIIDLIF